MSVMYGGKIVFMSRDRVITATAPGVATQESPRSEPSSFKNSVFGDGFDGVLATCWRKTARWWKYRGDAGAIEIYREEIQSS